MSAPGVSVGEVLGAGKGYEMTKTGIVFQRALSDAEYDALGVRIAGIANATAWAIGDWLVAGSGRGEDGSSYTRAGQLTGRSYESLSQYCRVSAAYGHPERGLAAWSFYREALRLPSKERVRALEVARDNNWNRSGLIDYINTRLGESNALDAGGHDSDTTLKRVGATGWRGSNKMAPKRDVKCPSCGHRFDVRRKGLTEAQVEVGN
jgi:DNA-directed RNA polymerase subunit RPC12/RpoP